MDQRTLARRTDSQHFHFEELVTRFGLIEVVIEVVSEGRSLGHVELRATDLSRLQPAIE